MKQQSEVEIKLRLKDFPSTLQWLKNNAVLKKRFLKKDIYYAKKSSIEKQSVMLDECIRLRIENGGYTFCTKVRDMSDGVEINIEREEIFSKKRSSDIVRFIHSVLGYSEYVKKEKKGKCFVYKNAIIDISKVSMLGDFLEIEMLDSDLSIDEQIKHIKSIMLDMGLDESDVEVTPYVVLLSCLYHKKN